jgi:hypothetical protein
VGNKEAPGEEHTSRVNVVQGSCGMPENNMGTRGSPGRDRVSFGTDMSTEEEVSDGRLVKQKEPQMMAAVERLHAKKFRNKEVQNSEKKAILKVNGGGGNKRQKTPVKDYVKGALKCLMDTEEGEAMTHTEGEELMEQQAVDTVSGAIPPMVTPKHLTGTHGESRQEK